jgi:peptidoglycan/LPS O-acetylase OafA/YrhL
MQFRKDINGLRAIAVIAVVLFHFNASWMPGGFVGVDVFFVISSFLMTRIIFKGIGRPRLKVKYLNNSVTYTSMRPQRAL